MFKMVIVFFLLNLYSVALSSTKKNIISKLKQTNNLSFDFIQTIDGESENGNCIIEYPKKIYCEYSNLNRKIIVSNGKSLVIKNRNSGIRYIYPLNKTPLEFLLDKNYLISKIHILKQRYIDDKYVNFKVFENKNTINIFFDKKTFSLVGWQTEDVYQNLIVTFISSIKINRKIDSNIFILPKNN
jgi:outer membrane lipoprotein-sorting protein